MRQSKLFGRTIREAPKDEKSINARLLIRGGFVDKLMAGVYTFLPLGWRVMQKIQNIIREEMNGVGGQEVLMPSLQPKELWLQTDIGPINDQGWGRMRDIMYQMKDKSGRDIGFGCSHEEVAVDLVKRFISSYKDLPVAFYQFQNKFREEPRAKSGIIRGREFIMKDLYSFHTSAENLDKYYFEVAEAYKKIFARTDCGSLMVEASGGSFTKNFSHEFQAICEAGEDKVAHCESCDFAQNIEIFNSAKTEKCPKCGGKTIVSKSVETGNIFRFYDKYAKEMNMHYTDEKGMKNPIHLGSYGIGISRLMGTIAEIHNDKDGIVWPASVAPFGVHLIELGDREAAVKNNGEKLYDTLQKSGIEVLYDDRDATAGEKFADSDLIGIPLRLVISKRTLAKNSAELKKRSEQKSEIVPLEKIISVLNSYDYGKRI